jgi:hypothetical protein
MCCLTANITRRRVPARIRLLTTLICVFLLATVLLASSYIFTHAQHEHDQNGPHDSCATCACLSTAQNIIKIVTAALALSLITLASRSVGERVCASATRLDSATLVKLKVRLNN